jgi:drug/metabolite transporter (DMT)-like permease
VSDGATLDAVAVTGTTRGRLLLALSAVLFGSMFVPAQRVLEDLTPAGATALRFAVATLAVLPFCRRDATELRDRRRTYVRAGLIAGAANTVGFLLQSLALERTTASSTAFLASLFVVFVPVFAAVLARRLPSAWVVGGVVLAVFGSFLLTGASVQVQAGDALALGAAVAGAVHVMLMGYFATRLAVSPFNLVQLAAVALMAGAISLVVGVGELTATALVAVLYLGVAQAAGLGLQVVAQRDVDPTSSALILLLIPVVGAVMAVVVLDDPVSVQRVLGATLVVAAVLVAEVVPTRRSRTAPPLTPTGGGA